MTSRTNSSRSMFCDVHACKLPESSTLSERIASDDFIDCFRVEANTSPRRAIEIITNQPPWAKFLFSIRRLVTSPFGLSQDGPDAPDKVEAFPVESETETELIAGFDDKHLEFRVSVMVEQGYVYLATWVHPHHIFGRIYLRTIMPFHVAIARSGLARVKEQT